MGFLNLFSADRSRVYRYSQDAVRSADRLIRWHDFYANVDNDSEKPIRYMYLQELKIMISRCLKLSFYLLTHRRRTFDKD